MFNESKSLIIISIDSKLTQFFKIYLFILNIDILNTMEKYDCLSDL